MGGVRGLVIIEVDINGAQIPSPDTRRPSPEGLGRVAAGIGGEAGAVQPNIGKIGRQLDGRLKTRDVEEAKGGEGLNRSRGRVASF